MKKIEVLERYNTITNKNDTNSLFYKIFTKYELEDLLSFIGKKGRISALQNTLRLLLDDIDSECFVIDENGDSVYSETLCSFTRNVKDEYGSSLLHAKDEGKKKMRLESRIRSKNPSMRIKPVRKSSFQRSPIKQVIRRKSSFKRSPIKKSIKKRSHFN